MTSNDVTSPCSIWDTRRSHAHRCGDIPLREAELLTGLGKLMSSGFGEQFACSGLDLSGGDTSGMQLLLQGFPVLRSPLRHVHYSSFSAV